MKKIVLFNNKGGVGKTTFLFHLGFALEHLGKKILFVDLDPQCNLTTYLLEESEIENEFQSRKTVYNGILPLIEGTGDISELEPFKKEGRNIWLLSGDIQLSQFEDILATAWLESMAGQQRGFRIISSIYRIIDKVSKTRNIDYVLIDVGPNLGSLNKTALLTCDNFFIPVIPDLFSIRGLENIGKIFIQWITQWKNIKDKLTLNFPIQEGKPTFSGYIDQNFNIYREDKTKSWTHWSKIIPDKVNSNVVKPFKENSEDLVIDLNDGSNCLGKFKNYHSLAPLSQKLLKPIFELRHDDEGMNSGYNNVIKQCKEEFNEIAKKVIKFI